MPTNSVTILHQLIFYGDCKTENTEESVFFRISKNGNWKFANLKMGSVSPKSLGTTGLLSNGVSNDHVTQTYLTPTEQYVIVGGDLGQNGQIYFFWKIFWTIMMFIIDFLCYAYR